MTSWSYKAPLQLTDEQYVRWQDLLEQRTGISFLHHKSILQKGLIQRMREIEADDFESYYEKVSRVPEGMAEWLQLVDKISVKETSFFRDQISFRSVRNHLLKRLSSTAEQDNNTLDLWSVGCSTGEEAFSLAILANDVLSFLNKKLYLAVFATDISSSALAIARQGRYQLKDIEGVPKAFRQKYFNTHSDTEVELTAELQNRVCFIQGNIQDMEQFPKMPMDVIYCQNVFVYFSRDRQHYILDQLVEQLKSGGLLMIGPGEVMGWKNPKVSRTVDNKVQSYIREKF